MVFWMTMRVGQALLVMRKGRSAASTISSVVFISSYGILPRPLVRAVKLKRQPSSQHMCPYVQLFHHIA